MNAWMNFDFGKHVWFFSPISLIPPPFWQPLACCLWECLCFVYSFVLFYIPHISKIIIYLSLPDVNGHLYNRLNDSPESAVLPRLFHWSFASCTTVRTLQCVLLSGRSSVSSRSTSKSSWLLLPFLHHSAVFPEPLLTPDVLRRQCSTRQTPPY